jgi:hypothetical protein
VRSNPVPTISVLLCKNEERLTPLLFVDLIFRISTIKFCGISHFLMQNRHRLPQFFSLLSLHGLFLLENSANGHFEARCEKLLAAHFAVSQAVRRTPDEMLCVWK